MKDNLPEIKVKGYEKEKKGGFLGLLRGAGAGAPGAGGASAGIGSLIAGNLGTVLAVLVAAGVGISVVADKADRAAKSRQQGQLASVAQGKKASTQAAEYVPAIMRSEAANKDASSLSMFTETNKGSGLALADGSMPQKAQQQGDSAADGASQSAEAPEGAEGAEGGADGIVDGAMAEAQGQAGLTGNSLSSSLGGGAGKSMNFGSRAGIDNKMSLGNNVGAGFQGMPRFKERQSKLLGMKSAARPVTASLGAGGRGNFSGSGKAWRQANAVKGMSKRAYESGKGDTARSTMDAAWEGNTATDEATVEGGGMEEGLVTSPSLDNLSGAGGSAGGGSSMNFDTPQFNLDTCGCDLTAGQDAVSKCLSECDAIDGVTEWAEDAKTCNTLIMASVAISLIAAAFVKVGLNASTTGIGAVFGGEAALIIGYVLAGIAAVLAAVALGYALYIGFHHKQAWMGTMYGLGAGLAVGAAAAAAFGQTEGAVAVPTSWVAVAAGLSSTIAGTLGKP